MIDTGSKVQTDVPSNVEKSKKNSTELNVSTEKKEAEAVEKKKLIEEGAKLIGIPAQPTQVNAPTVIPPPRPSGIVLRDPIKYTSSGLDVSVYDQSTKGKGKMAEQDIEKPLSVVQTQINLQMTEVTEYANSKMDVFDEWYEFRTKVFAKKLLNKNKLKRFVSLERSVLKAVRAITIEQAIDRREYLFYLMRLKKLTISCGLLRMNYDPTGPTAYDDYAILSQLDMDLITLQMKIRFWEQDKPLYVPVEDQESPANQDSALKSPSTEAQHTSQPTSSMPTFSYNLESDRSMSTEVPYKDLETEKKMVEGTTDLTNQQNAPVETETQLSKEQPEDVSLLNIDDVVGNVTKEIQQAAQQAEISEELICEEIMDDQDPDPPIVGNIHSQLVSGFLV